MTIGEKIKQARIAKGMTQEELAEKLGYKSRSSVNKIETGGRDIPRSQIKRIAEILEVSPISLLGLEDEAKEYGQYKMPIINDVVDVSGTSAYKMSTKKQKPQRVPNQNGEMKVEVRGMNKTEGMPKGHIVPTVKKTPSGLYVDRHEPKIELVIRSRLPELNEEGLKEVLGYIDGLVEMEKYTKKG